MKIGPKRSFPSVEELKSQGKALRKRVPRTSHASWGTADRPDPLRLIRAQDRARVSDLVPIRYGRMLESAFACFRGSAVVMATDLSRTPTTGVKVQACGDAHLMNFGAYATPERNFVFDINDFDESLPAPWEWDVKRLAASVVVAGRNIPVSERRCEEALLAALQRYREHTARLAQMTRLNSWYSHLDAEKMLRSLAGGGDQIGRLESSAQKQRSRTPEVVLHDLTQSRGGRRRFVDNPPFVYHSSRERAHAPIMKEVLRRYRESLRSDLRVLLDNYELVDVAVKVVGVGSVGTRCGMLLLMAGEDDALVLQAKEATSSVLEAYAGRSGFGNHGQRVVSGQRVMQAASDMFLGWTSYLGHDYYVRQLRDMKASVQLEELTGRSFVNYAAVCGEILARAHSRSGRAAQISGYLGRANVFDVAVAQFALKYADQTERDYRELRSAAKKGEIKAKIR